MGDRMVCFPKLNGSNFDNWSFKMKLLPVLCIITIITQKSRNINIALLPPSTLQPTVSMLLSNTFETNALIRWLPPPRSFSANLLSSRTLLNRRSDAELCHSLLGDSRLKMPG